MSAFTPADQAIRDAIRDRVDVNMCVEAGAGTGKTSVLVERIVQILRTGWARVDEIAVVTFTEKAAAELAARVRQGLDAALAAPSDAGERARLDAAVRGLNQAHIETIHAFAAALLRERPVEAGLDPGFRVLEDLPSQLSFESAYEDWLADATAGSAPPDALLDALDLGLEMRLVREAAEVLHGHRDLLPLPAYADTPVDLIDTLRQVEGRLAAVRDLAPRTGITDAAHTAHMEIAAATEELALLRDRPAALRRAIATIDLPSWRLGNQKNWHRVEHCRQVKAALNDTKELLGEATAAMRGNATARLVTWLQGFVDYYAARRRADGAADFEDLLIWARDLVRNRRDVRRYFQAKYRCILVDEFQDTDPLQVELIVFLCEDGATATDWRDATLRAGSLFVVGDPKQSIYRFRRADIGMYDAVKEHVFGGEVQEIVQNFRSVAPVVDWVNRTFAPLFPEQAGVHPRYIALRAAPATVASAGVVQLRGSVAGRGDAAGFAGQQRHSEADALASLIRREVDAGGWAVRDGDGPRPATYRDIAVLVPARTDLFLYEEALARAGVPHRHEGGRAFFQRQEVRELVAVLRAIDDPADGVAAVAALRSSAFGCSDEELLLYRAAGLRFSHERVPDGAPEPVASSLRTLHAWAGRRHDSPLPDLVRAVVDEGRLVEFAMLQPQGDQTAANLLKLIDQARAFADAGGGGLRGFVRWLKENIARAADETDASISEETDDVVRILTMHAAKGLEFPVVVLANIGGSRVDRTSVIADRAAGRLHVKLGKKDEHFRTPGFSDGAALELAHEMAEERRKLYVAATRAKDLLVLPLFTAEDQRARDWSRHEPRSLLEWLLLAGAGDDGDAGTIDAATLPALVREPPVWRREPRHAPEPAVRDAIERRESWIAARAALVDTAAAPARVVTATALKPEWEPPAAPAGDVRRGSATEFGSAVHALLERIDLRRPDDAALLAESIAREFGLAARAAEIERLARTTLGSDAIARALRSRRVLRETPFAVPLPDAPERGVAEGRIDLLFEEDGEIVIVDFKSDAVTGDEIAARAALYRNQALVYAWAARAATGRPVREVVFLFARTGEARSMIADAAFMAEADELMRGAGAALLEPAAT
ncbi:MAG TPA: UvrD-helicase domain-containing protein [Dehalococcoidia bacterium]|nr:UvrD-helicase domain-containing protein [Dehalococcoidia bacterium]